MSQVIHPTSLVTHSKNLLDNINGVSNKKDKDKDKDNASSVGSASASQERFLKLFIAQLQAQDPLNPLDNAQMTSQMAQISQVSGLEQLNKTMQLLVDAQSSTRSLMAASMVGRQVMVEGNQLLWNADGKKVTGALSLESNAAKVTIQVKDAHAKVVDSFTLNQVKTGTTQFDWDGRDSAKQPLPAGQYRFEVNATSSTDVSIAATPYMSQPVNAVAWDKSGSPQLVLGNGKRVSLAEVIQLS